MNGPRVSSALARARALHEEERTSAIAAWSVLVKPRIALMVAFAALVGGLLARGPAADLVRLAEAALWIVCLAAGASVFNQVLERDTDGLMLRTSRRPLVTGRIRVRDAILFGTFLGSAGTLGLALRFNALSSLLGLATLCAYALVYTPLKRVSTLNTVAGALPGAMPPLLGYAASAGAVHDWGWHLFALLFAWQFPHFMAIAWLYREDYARAGLKMLASLPESRGLAGRQALLYALVLLPISLVPAVRGDAGPFYVAGALVLGLGYVALSGLFALEETRPRARALLAGSLAYLPLVFTLILCDPLVRTALLQARP